MATDGTRATKTLSLSLRLDPKTKFIMDFMARVKGQSITTLVERAIKEVASNVWIGPQIGDSQSNWADFWDASEGVRTQNLIANPHYPTTLEEDELRAFAETHWQFFYTNKGAQHPNRGYLEILWPSVDRYLDIWREKKSEDFWAAGEAMKADIVAARVAEPDWPPNAPKKESERAGDLDDEIPF